VLQSRRGQPQGATPAPWQPADVPPAPPPRPAPVAPKAVEPAPEPAPEAEPEPEPSADEAVTDADETVTDAAPAAPAAPSGDFDLPRVRPERPKKASPDTAKRAATRSTKRTSTRASVAAKSWVEASGTVCPPSHPVKAKKTSFLYHLPGMAAYERTKPDRCYRDEAAAEADGLRKAAR
jgi:hypothetical protein